MNAILKDLLAFADRMGVVSKMHCYDEELCTVEGETRGTGKKFEITLRIKEEEENA